MLRLLTAGCFALLTMLVLPAPAAAQSNQIKCESQNYAMTRCQANTNGDVRLAQQLGSQPCIQGRSWGYDQRGVWVKDGCRAIFDIGYGGGYPGGGYPGGGYPGGGYPGGGYPGGSGGIIKCESFNYQSARCPANTSGGVQLSRQLGGRCQQGQSWGFDRNSIWVTQGCRAEFRVGYNNGGGYPGGGYPGGGGGYPGGGASYDLKCESQNYQPARCAANIRGNVTLTQQLGGQCRQGQSWGYDGRGVWVNNGCRAIFRINN